MPQIINTNVASLNAQRNLNASQRDQDTALQRLSSGLRINSSKDDAAGLAISTRFDAQIRGTSVAVRNSGDAISLAQTAEGALDSINTSLQRVRELALQSANDTNTSIDRQALQEEVDQLISEIQTVAESANFNGKKLLDGSFSNSVFQTGANVGDTVAVSITRLDAATLGAADSAGVSSNNSGTALTAEQTIAAGDLLVNGVSIGAPVGSEDNSSFALQGSSAISKASAINKVSDQTGVTATANVNTIEGTSIAAGAATAVAAETVTINGVGITLSVAAVETEAALTGVADAINNKAEATGVTASVVATSTGFRVDLSAEDGRNITVDTATGGAEDFGLADDGVDGTAVTFIGNITLTSDDGSDIEIGTNTQNIDNFGFEEGTFSGSTASVVGDSAVDTARAALVAGDVTLNGISVGATSAADDTASTGSESASAIALAAAVNEITDQTGITATANENKVYSAAVGTTGGAFAITINGAAIAGTTLAGAGNLSTNQSTIMDAINAKSGITGVTAEALDNDQFTLTAADGRNIVLATGTAGDTGLTADTYISGVTLEGGGRIEIGTLTGNVENSGLRVGSFGASESGTLLSELDISTVSGAQDAIKAVDNAINTVASRRAELGAIQNRFESTIANLEITRENLSAANSRIQDADFAQETAALSKSQVLQQAGISVLAQANARPQQVLSLLQ